MNNKKVFKEKVEPIKSILTNYYGDTYGDKINHISKKITPEEHYAVSIDVYRISKEDSATLFKEVEDTIPKRSQRVWNGMGWTYQWYLAPTKDEAMLFLMDALDSQRRYYEGKINELKVNK